MQTTLCHCHHDPKKIDCVTGKNCLRHRPIAALGFRIEVTVQN